MSQNQCKASCSANITRNTTASTEKSSSSAAWQNMSNYTQLMDSLILFMNQTWLFVSELKEKSGSSDPLKMSEEERQAKINEILQLLEEKDKEIRELEQEKARLEASNNKNRSQAAATSAIWTPPSLPSSSGAFLPEAHSSFREAPRSLNQSSARHSYGANNCLNECMADCSPQYTEMNMSYSGAGYYTPPIPGPSLARGANRSLGNAQRAAQRYVMPAQTSQYGGYGCDPACQFSRTM